MNKNKVSNSLLNKVSILENNSKEKIFVSSKNFYKAKEFLISSAYCFQPYRFANCFSLLADTEDINILSNQDCIDYIFPNRKANIETSSHSCISLENLTQNKYLGQNQNICFIDTGISPRLDFLLPKNKIIKFVDFIKGETYPYDDNGHGTFVSGVACNTGILSKSVAGISPCAKILSLKALGENGSSNSNVILDAMEWIYQNQKVYNIKIVCMSFGADSEEKIDPLSKGAETLWKQGITIVAAAGNSGPNKSTIKSPGNNPYIITVGALDPRVLNVPDFSSRGPTIYGNKPDLLAPGVEITSCSNGKLPYTKMSGTSVATPIVAGICANLLSKEPDLSNEEIKKFLLSNCTKITGDVNIEGAGYINFMHL